ncbi:cytosine permease [Sulfuracidifex tepidarius]|uniref:cytosine permease n=1 Tax=Sulfuracidifex tepidarius TaxID=1294262 RepID=UPI0006CF7356|nr:cytosine permease [Sulfuracidifex tepidarius]
MIIATVIGLALGAWSFLGSAYNFVDNWLLAYGTALGIIVGINVADYVVMKKFSLDTNAIFIKNSKYWYWKGINPASLITFAVLSLILYSPDLGLKVGFLEDLAQVGPLSGLLMGMMMYLVLMKVLKLK